MEAAKDKGAVHDESNRVQAHPDYLVEQPTESDTFLSDRMALKKILQH
jgi:hypothetical protein